MLGRVPGLPWQEWRRACKSDQDAARDERTCSFRWSTWQPLSQVTKPTLDISVVGRSFFEFGSSYDILPAMGSKSIVESNSVHIILDPYNKPPPSEASLSSIRESRHLVLVLPTNGLDTCINRLVKVMITPYFSSSTLFSIWFSSFSSTGWRARKWRTTYSTLKFWPLLQLEPRSSPSLQTSRYWYKGTDIGIDI